MSRPIDGWEGESDEERTQAAWTRMLDRCDNDEHGYRKLGIEVCERWRTYDNFVEDMGYAPPGYSLERDDVYGDYEPGNCRWIPWREQMENTRAARRERDLWNRR